MKLISRIAGTWVLGMALILVVLDGAKSLATNELVITPISVLWASVHNPSWVDFSAKLIASETQSPISASIVNFLVTMPACGVFAAIGAALVLLGTKRDTARFVATY